MRDALSDVAIVLLMGLVVVVAVVAWDVVLHG